MNIVRTIQPLSGNNRIEKLTPTACKCCPGTAHLRAAYTTGKKWYGAVEKWYGIHNFCKEIPNAVLGP